MSDSALIQRRDDQRTLVLELERTYQRTGAEVQRLRAERDQTAPKGLFNQAAKASHRSEYERRIYLAREVEIRALYECNAARKDLIDIEIELTRRGI